MPAPLTIKTLLNQYRIEEFITTTPLGELYRATEERSQKAIALTTPPAETSAKIKAFTEH